MTSGARLAGALLLALAGLVLGWARGSSGADGSLDASGLRWSQLEIAEPSAIDSFVARIASSNLLPRAELRSIEATQDAESPVTADQLAELISTSDLAAFVQRGEIWRLHAYSSPQESTIYEAGDALDDGWIIDSIHADQVVLRRDGEERTLKAFDPGTTDNET